MKVRIAAEFEGNSYLRIDGGTSTIGKVLARGEVDAVGAGPGIGREGAATPVGVGKGLVDAHPGFVLLLVQSDANPCAGFAQNDVENMGCDCAHCASHFLRRMCMIWRCCSAASC